jgi:hypothetical protein
MGIEAYVPAWRSSERPKAPAANVTGDAPVKVALVANGKPNSAELLEALARHVGERLAIADVRTWRKASVSVPPSPEQLAEIVGWADVALVAIGD